MPVHGADEKFDLSNILSRFIRYLDEALTNDYLSHQLQNNYPRRPGNHISKPAKIKYVLQS